MTQFALLISCVLVFTMADYFAARWGHTHDRLSLVVVLVVGPFAYLLFGHLAAATSLTKMAAFVCCGIVLGGAAAGFLLLGERANRLTWLGLGIIIAGLVTLGLGKVHQGDT